MQCTNKRCRYPIPPHMRECPVCREAVGFPNVRACDTPDEKVALDARYRNAMRSARGKGSRTILRRFEDAVGRSKAVICRSLSVVQRFMSDDEQLYNTFYNMVDSNARIPEDNRWDRSREAVDAMLFPHYHRHMCFAALSLNDKGPTGYGDHCMVLRTAFIANRASTFEENTYVFAEKHRLVATEPVPPGYRATWDDRARLAVAKLESALGPGTTDSEFPEVLLDSTGKRDGDLVEVHIYDTIHRRAIEKVIGPRAVKRGDGPIVASLKRKLVAIGSVYEVV